MDDQMRRIMRRYDKNELIDMVERGEAMQRERDALREQVARLEKMLREVQEFVSLVEYSDAFDNIYWAMHEDMKTAIDAALAAIPAPTPARETEEETEIERLTELLREAYPYLPMAVSLAEELAEMFPDIARPQDRTTAPATEERQ